MKLLVFSHLYIAFCATAMTCETFFITGKYSLKTLPYLLVVFCSTLFVYNLKGVNAGLINKEGTSMKKEWAINNKKFIFVIFSLSLATTLSSVFFLKSNSVLLLFFLGIISIGYSLPFKYGNYKIALREIPFLKTLLVAIVWTMVVAYIPFVESGSWYTIKWDWIISDFLFLFSLALLFDIKDLNEDQKESIQTIPLFVGVQKTKLLSVGLLLVRFFMLAIVIQYKEQLFCEFLITLLSISFLSIFVKSTSSEYFFMKWIDGLMLVKCLVTFTSACLIS